MDNAVLLSFRFGSSGSSSFASASLISYNNQFFIATAAHCLYDLSTNKIADHIQIQISNDKKVEHYSVSSVIIPKKWVETNFLKYDYAFARVRLPKNKTYITLTPHFDAAEIIQHNPNLVSFAGYPATLFNKKKRYSKNEIDFSLFEIENLIGMKSKLKSGISGGPWYMEINGGLYQIGVTSAKIKSHKNIVWAPLWDQEAKLLLDKLASTRTLGHLILG